MKIPANHTGLHATALIALLLFVSACRVNDPGAGQTISMAFTPDRTPAASGVSYGPGGHQKLDVYPAVGQASGLAIVFVHGGGWVAGSRENAETGDVIQYLMDQGHVVFSIDYTLGDCVTSPFPDNLDDVKWAIGWANQAAKKSQYGYTKLAVLGVSAGAHLTGLATVSSDNRPAGIPSGYNIRPDAGIALGGPSDMTTFGAQGTPAQQAAQLNFFGLNLVECFFGQPYLHPDDVPALLKIGATADFYVDQDDPPLYIASGTADALALPPFNADKLEQRYIDLGAGKTFSAWNDRIEGGGHNLEHIVNIGAVDLFIALLLDDFFG